jgi:hypothetical protein
MSTLSYPYRQSWQVAGLKRGLSINHCVRSPGLCLTYWLPPLAPADLLVNALTVHYQIL